MKFEEAFKINEQVKANLQEVEPVVSKYGWSAVQNGQEIILHNRKGKPVVNLVIKGSKYKAFDTGGVKLMSGNGQLAVSVEKLLTQFYCCQPV